ncbi:cellulose biosynthesis protein BcsQ [Kineococcus xinjiangensis]|uniref:Cellulose biosynthesis protein BcsQ n=1 Tax=Kineococcus xinjiangensis TaxID=512762 RepID=A0A2S6ID75_9ACTN|nr:ParA family protein [Kineococcus xinjiangensis]PPK92172.1 cellulose biosynthesis protein BcsQ [Kineococcus xinjiangensis]
MIVLSVCSLKGGVGKTSVTLGLAAAALRRGIATLVVDLDPQADATSGLDVTARRPHDLAAVLATPKRKVVDGAVAPSGWAGDHPGQLDVLVGSGSSALRDDPEVTGRALQVLSTALRKAPEHDLVLLDCPPSLGALTRSAWACSDAALVVSDAGRFSVAAVDRTLRELAAQDGAARPLGVVVNRYLPRSPEQRFRHDELRELVGELLLPPVPERAAIQQAQGAGVPLHALRGAAARELCATFDDLLGRVLAVSPAGR